eukprot:10195371-Karenia_brevis.AAC.1
MIVDSQSLGDSDGDASSDESTSDYRWLAKRVLESGVSKPPDALFHRHLESGKGHKLRGPGACVFKCGRPNSH